MVIDAGEGGAGVRGSLRELPLLILTWNTGGGAAGVSVCVGDTMSFSETRMRQRGEIESCHRAALGFGGAVGT